MSAFISTIRDTASACADGAAGGGDGGQMSCGESGTMSANGTPLMLRLQLSAPPEEDEAWLLIAAGVDAWRFLWLSLFDVADSVACPDWDCSKADCLEETAPLDDADCGAGIVFGRTVMRGNLFMFLSGGPSNRCAILPAWPVSRLGDPRGSSCWGKNPGLSSLSGFPALSEPGTNRPLNSNEL